MFGLGFVTNLEHRPSSERKKERKKYRQSFKQIKTDLWFWVEIILNSLLSQGFDLKPDTIWQPQAGYCFRLNWKPNPAYLPRYTGLWVPCRKEGRIHNHRCFRDPLIAQQYLHTGISHSSLTWATDLPSRQYCNILWQLSVKNTSFNSNLSL